MSIRQCFAPWAHDVAKSIWTSTFKQGVDMYMDSASVMLCFQKLCCKLSFSGFLSLTGKLELKLVIDMSL